MSNKKDDIFYDDSFIADIQKEIIAEIQRRIDSGVIDTTRLMTAEELTDVERTARDTVEALWIAKKNT